MVLPARRDACATCVGPENGAAGAAALMSVGTAPKSGAAAVAPAAGAEVLGAAGLVKRLGVAGAEVAVLVGPKRPGAAGAEVVVEPKRPGVGLAAVVAVALPRPLKSPSAGAGVVVVVFAPKRLDVAAAAGVLDPADEAGCAPKREGDLAGTAGAALANSEDVEVPELAVGVSGFFAPNRLAPAPAAVVAPVLAPPPKRVEGAAVAAAGALGFANEKPPAAGAGAVVDAAMSPAVPLPTAPNMPLPGGLGCVAPALFPPKRLEVGFGSSFFGWPTFAKGLEEAAPVVLPADAPPKRVPPVEGGAPAGVVEKRFGVCLVVGCGVVDD